jgi:hypothetical protein
LFVYTLMAAAAVVAMALVAILITLGIIADKAPDDA